MSLDILPPARQVLPSFNVFVIAFAAFKMASNTFIWILCFTSGSTFAQFFAGWGLFLIWTKTGKKRRRKK